VDNLESAYIAGFFDGEGCVTITNYTYTNGKQYFSLQLHIANTNYSVLGYIQSKFGGTIYSRNNGGNRKIGHFLRLHSEKAKYMLESIYPYLKVKSRQAEIGLEFQSTMTGFVGNQYISQLPDSIVNYRNILKEELGILNRRGI